MSDGIGADGLGGGEGCGEVGGLWGVGFVGVCGEGLNLWVLRRVGWWRVVDDGGSNSGT